MISSRARQISENLKGTLGESNALPASSFVSFLLEDSMKRIPLTQGQYALVDGEDYEKLNIHKWYACYRDNTQSYRAVKTIYPDGRPVQLIMSRYIMGEPKGMQVDHRNHNTLDNQKSNLRICTNQ